MGGYGSGNQRQRDARPLTVERIRLDVGAFRRHGLPLDVVEPGRRALSVTMRGGALYTWRAVEPLAALEGGPLAPAGACLVRLEGAGPPLRVPLDWRRVGYGWRPWWICPTCDARARILYGPTAAAAASSTGRAPLWTCRTCAALAYESTRQPDRVRARIRETRAAAAAGLTEAKQAAMHNAFNPAAARLPVDVRRPPRMRLRTWLRRLDAWQHARAIDELTMLAEFGRGWPLSFGGAEFAAARRYALDALAADRAQRRAARAAR